MSAQPRMTGREAPGLCVTYEREDTVAEGGLGQRQWQHLVLGILSCVAITLAIILALGF